MAGDVFLYSVLGILVLLAVFSLFIGIEKMIKLVIGNYILMGIILPFSIVIDMVIKYFGTKPTQTLLGILFSKRQAFFINGHITITLLVYVASLLLLFTQSTLSILIPQEEKKRIIFLVLLVPLTVFSIIFALEIVLFGSKILLPDTLTILANKITNTPFIKNFILFTPLWMTIHGVITLIITTQLRISFTFQKEPYDAPEES